MELRIDKITKLPGLIKGGATYTLILKGEVLYLIKTGKYIDFDHLRGHVITGGIEGRIGGAIGDMLVDKMNAGRLQDVQEKEKTVSGNEEALIKEKDSYKISKSDIVESNFNADSYKLKLKTTQGKFKFYFPTVCDRSKVPDLVNALK